jgi:hypothetical protein
MKTEKIRIKKAALIVTLVAFGFALYTQVIWAVVAMNKSNVQEDPVQSFLSYFPPIFRNIATITYVTLLCSIATIILSSRWMGRERGITKVIAIIILIMAILIMLLTLFQLM